MIIDFHTHILPPALHDRREEFLPRDATLEALFSRPEARMATAEELVASMDEAGVDISVALGMGWNDLELCRLVNDYIIEATRRFPSRLRGFCSVNPLWGSAAAAEVERCARAGLVGIGELHPHTQGFDLGDRDTMAPLVEVALARGMPILTHTSEPVGHLYPGKGSTTPEVVCRFVESFPEVTLICAHWGGGLPFYTLMPEVSISLEHVFFDTAASPFLYRSEIFTIVTTLVGAEKILLGTDYPLIKQKRLIRQVAEASISEEARERILYANAARLLGIPAWKNDSAPS
ncbi:MAG: Amidohydro-rel protein [Dehalococcoidia bacterium]|nr:Amidohydro-rel protein [Dehalococcoidia bacterium]